MNNISLLKEYIDFQFYGTEHLLTEENEDCQKTLREVGHLYFTTLTTLLSSCLSVAEQMGWKDLLLDGKKEFKDEPYAFVVDYFTCYSGFALCRSKGGNTVERYLRVKRIDNILNELE